MFEWFTRSSADTSHLLSNFITACPIAIAELDADARIMRTNHPCRQILRSTQEHSMLFSDVIAEAERDGFIKLVQAVQSGEPVPVEATYTLTIPEQKDVVVSLSLTAVPGAMDDDPIQLYAFLSDMTEQKNLEMRFAHSQKMQAVGQLAGGVAHDFNNLLTAMIGFCDLLLMRHPAGDPSFADIMQIKQNANRAANLVRQLLAFSRRQTLQPKRIDLMDLLSELSNLMRRLIGENIELHIDHQRGLWPVKVDQGQLEQVLINLAVNARDAMPEGGKLNIRTANITIDNTGIPDKQLRVPPQEDMIAPGDYVEVVIDDTGTGIPEDVIDNIFEPFFSTKEVGSGTGLGLSTVYGIIKQTGGYIYLKTSPRKGTSFHLYIPRLHDSATDTPEEGSEQPDAQDLTGAATVLLVEDETPVRIFAARALQNKGYHVLEADCGESGIEVYEANHQRIEAIITDVVMPGMNGPAMIDALDETFSDSMRNVRVIFMSGYTEEAFADGYDGEREFNFLSKPFTLKQLAAKLKELTHTADAS